MPTFRITSPDGKTYRVTAPEGSTQEEALARVKAQHSVPATIPAPPAGQELMAAHTPAAEPYDVPPAVASAMNIAQAPLFGFGDELVGLVAGEGEKERTRATIERLKQQYPKSALLGTIAGGMATGMAGGGKLLGAKLAARLPQFLAAPTTVGQTLKNAAVIGGASGALQGAGEAETTGDIPAGAGIGLAAGVIGGPVLQGFGAGVGSALRAGAAKVAPKVAETLARQQVVRAMIRDTRAAMGGLEDVADVDVLPLAIRKFTGRLEKLGPRAVLADAGPQSGAATRQQLDLMASMPGTTGSKAGALTARRVNTRSRVLQGSAAEGLSPGGGRAGDLLEILTEKQAVEAGPLYTALHQQSITPGPELVRALESIKKAGGFKAAAEIANADVGRLGPEAAFTLPITGPKLDVTSQTVGYPTVRLRDLDNAKRGIDRLIEGEFSEGRYTNYGKSLIQLKNHYLSLIDQATVDPTTGVSTYRAARDAFAGPAAMKTAAKLGRTAMSKDDAAVRELTQGLSESELQAFKVGAYEGLRDKLGSAPGITQIMHMGRDPKIADKIKEIFGDQKQFRKFASAIAKEARIKRLDAVGGGSQTFLREAAAEDLNSSVLRDMGELYRGVTPSNLPEALSTIGRMYNRVATPEPVRNAIGNILLSRPTSEQLNALSTVLADRAKRGAISAAGAGMAVTSPLEDLTR